MTLKSFDFNAFTLSLTPLLAVALLVERTIEVFFGLVRAPGDQQALADNLSNAPEDARVRVMAGEDPAAAFPSCAARKADNTQIAFGANAVLSVIVALVGVRVLALLIEPRQPSWPTPCQLMPGGGNGNLVGAPGWWQFIDVVLTAGLIGGGASGFHELTQVLGTWVGRARQAGFG